MHKVDILIAGGGAAGLSLACQLVRGPLSGQSIAVVECAAKNQNDRTWCYWTRRATLVDPIVCRSWNQVRVVAEDFARTLDLGPYRYEMVRGGDFYHYAHQTLAAHPNVQLARGRVERIEDGPDGAHVVTDDQAVAATWVFDSRFAWSKLVHDATTDAHFHTLRQAFTGWEVETSRDAFDPDQPTLMDFRASQAAGLSFVHVLPLSRRLALVDLVVCAIDAPSPVALAQALDGYLREVLQLGNYSVLREEHGITPMTDRPFPRRVGQHIMSIGIHGGQVKPSTGYAFMRMQKDAEAIASSLAEHGHPFHVPQDARGFRYFDAALLDILEHQPEDAIAIFTALFKHNTAERIFRFLDGEATHWEILQMVPALPSRLLKQSISDFSMLARV
jgi:lycopene beta-cyclase